jgi:hypothetical protein
MKGTTYPITTIGSNLHMTNEVFWNTITEKMLMDSKDVEKTIRKLYYSLIPENELTDFIKELAEAFVWFETNRITGIYNELGKTKTAIQEYVFPLCHELGIENWSRHLMGFIDRIDRCTNDVLAAIEYKYGKPKDIQIDWQKSLVMRELGFYAILPQGKEVYVLQPDDTVIPIKEHLGFKPQFYYGAMLFFQDINNTASLYKINQLQITAVNKRIENYWKALDTGQFPCSPRDSCYNSCNLYWDHCELNPRWLEIEHTMDDMVRPELLIDQIAYDIAMEDMKLIM